MQEEAFFLLLPAGKIYQQEVILMSHYSDPTASAAIGAVDRELRLARREARRLRKLRDRGQLTWQEEQAARRRFTGICRRVLEDALG